MRASIGDCCYHTSHSHLHEPQSPSMSSRCTVFHILDASYTELDVNYGRAMVAKRRGRPPAGPRGQPRATMRQISARIPDETYTRLKALTVVLQISQADAVAKAVEALEQSLGEAELRLVRLLRKRDAP